MILFKNNQSKILESKMQLRFLGSSIFSDINIYILEEHQIKILAVIEVFGLLKIS